MKRFEILEPLVGELTERQVLLRQGQLATDSMASLRLFHGRNDESDRNHYSSVEQSGLSPVEFRRSS